MEGSHAYVRSNLKADLRNTRTLLAIVAEAAARAEPSAADADAMRQLHQLVHDVTIGLRAGGPDAVDVDVVRRFVAEGGAEAVRQRRLAEDTLAQCVRSLERVLPWWCALPTVETLLDDARWPPPADATVAQDIRVNADERFRIQGLPRTRDAVRARFEKQVSKYPWLESLRLVGEDGAVVFALVRTDGHVRLAS